MLDKGNDYEDFYSQDIIELLEKKRIRFRSIKLDYILNRGLNKVFICRYFKVKIYANTLLFGFKKTKKIKKDINNYACSENRKRRQIVDFDFIQRINLFCNKEKKLLDEEYEYVYTSFYDWKNHIGNLRYYRKLREYIHSYLKKKNSITITLTPEMRRLLLKIKGKKYLEKYNRSNEVYSGWPSDIFYETPKQVIDLAFEYKESKYDVKINIKGNYYCYFLRIINLIFNLESMLYGLGVGYFSIYEIENTIDEIVNWLEINIGYNRKTYYGNRITEFAYYIQEEIYDLEYYEEITKGIINIRVRDLINMEKRICAYFRYEYNCYREKYARQINEFGKIYEQL